MTRSRILPLLALLILTLSASSSYSATSLVVDHIDIPQVDYEPAIYYDEGDPLPIWLSSASTGSASSPSNTDAWCSNLTMYEWRYYRRWDGCTPSSTSELVTTRCGRTTSCAPGLQTTPLAGWLWIGGIEYTLPGYEHGTTFAIPWTWKILENHPDQVSMSMATTEPLTA